MNIIKIFLFHFVALSFLVIAIWSFLKGCYYLYLAVVDKEERK